MRKRPRKTRNTRRENRRCKLKMNEMRGMLDVAQNMCNIAHLDKLAKRDLPTFFNRSQTLMTSTEGNAPIHKNSIILDPYILLIEEYNISVLNDVLGNILRISGYFFVYISFRNKFLGEPYKQIIASNP